MMSSRGHDETQEWAMSRPRAGDGSRHFLIPDLRLKEQPLFAAVLLEEGKNARDHNEGSEHV